MEHTLGDRVESGMGIAGGKPLSAVCKRLKPFLKQEIIFSSIAEAIQKKFNDFTDL